MSEREKNILTSAFAVFARYGMKRATMNDIAEEAGVARQTLYNAFSNKEAILRALMEKHYEETLALINQHLNNGGSLADGLDLLFEHTALRPYDLLNETPHGHEILEGITQSAKEIFDKGNIELSAAATELFQTVGHVSRNARARELGDFVVFGAIGMKHKAQSKEHLVQLLSTLKSVVLEAAKN